MKTLKKLLFAALATIGFSFAAEAADEPLGVQTPMTGGWRRMVKTDTGTDLVLCYTDTATAGFTWTVPDNVTSIEYLVVGGGGGGGGSGSAIGGGGGGGGGGVVTNTAPYAVDAGSTLTVMVGVGGDAGSGGSSGNKGLGGNGDESKILLGDDEIAKALGGGGGAGGSLAALSTGANGGGGNASKTTGGTGVAGYNGGNGNSGNNAKTGGGGAGAGHGGYAPVTSGTKHAGNGGEGIYSGITGEIICYGGGGGGGKGSTGSNTYAAGLGGDGGGGNGGTTLAGYAGTDGLGGGGGGNGNSSGSTAKGGKGGDGAVIIRYTMPTEDYLPINIAEYQNLDVAITALGVSVSDGDTMYKELPIVVVATPQVGYEYTEVPEGWTLMADARSITREFTAGESSFEIDIPVADAVTYNFALTQSNRGSADASKVNGTYGSGQLITLDASANEGYFFAGWLVNGEKAGWLQNELTIMMDEDKAVEPVFYRIDPTFGYDYAVEGGDEVVMCTNSAKTITFTVPDYVTAIDYLVVGGGGAGGSSGTAIGGGGGGGGGGVVSNIAPCSVVTGSALTITVGAGGTVGTSVGGDGETSKILDGGAEIVAALGGGGGAGGSKDASSTGANGGGGNASKTTGGTGVSGNNGGNGNSGNNAKTGGGGAGAGHGGYAPVTSGTRHAGNGGEGVYSGITGEIICYGGGGGGGKGSTGSNTYAAGLGGDGGGGNGGTTLAGYAGTDGLGGGGGGNGNSTSSSAKGGKGGDGVVILRYTPAFPVTFSAPENATISVKVDGLSINSDDIVLNGEDVVVEVTPDKNYEYAEAPEGWTKVEDSTAITCTFTVDYWDLVIEAPAPTEKPTFTVTTLACENGSIEGAGTFHRDEVVTLTAIPADGYAFKAWTGAAEGYEGASIQITVTESIEVGATFEKMAADKRLVLYTGGENTSYTVKLGDEDVTSGSAVDVDATIVVVVTPNEHCAFVGALDGWETVEDSKSLTKTFTANEDITFEIPNAALITFELTVTQPEHGVIRGAESGTLTEGDPVELSVEFDEDVYQFLRWETNGVSAGTETTLSFTMQSDMTVVAVIEKIPPVEVSITNDETKQSYVVTTNGVEITSGSEVDWNTIVTVVATSKFGYKYATPPDGWSAGKDPRSITREFTANAYPLEIAIPDAEAIDVYSLSITEPVNGTVSGAEPGQYEIGDQVSLTAYPEVGYRLSGWTVNGEDAGAANPFTLTLEANATVAAVFSEVKIPRPYVRVEYISTTSTGKQYVDTGIGMQNKLRVEFDFKWNAVSKTDGEYLMGGNYDSKMQYVLNLSKNNVWRGGVDANRLHEYTTLPKAVQDKRYTVESLFDNTVHTLTIDGLSESYTGTTKTSQASGHLFLFNYTKDSGYPGDATLYSCRMFTGASSTNQGTLVREFLPVYDRETEKYGLYDTVNGTFYPSARGDFIGAKVQVQGLAIMFY